MQPIPVIDIFAGPGGLSEGFSSLKYNEKPAFRVALSVEKDEHAHKTLKLRAFCRQFWSTNQSLPRDYYDFVSGQGSITQEELYEKYPKQARLADEEALCVELGKYQPDLLDKKIKNALGNSNSWVLIGGPPCQAYSLVGRSRNKGNGEYKPEEDQRHFLYQEYLRIISVHWPSIFVMENVKGILSASVKKNEFIFDQILKDLRNPSQTQGTKSKYTYRLYSFTTGREPENNKDFLIRAEDYGIPQARHRVIVLGIRNDILEQPCALKKQRKVFIEHVIKGLPELRSGLSRTKDSLDIWQKQFYQIWEKPWYKNLPPELKRAIRNAEKEIRVSSLKRLDRKLGTSPLKYSDWFCDENLQCTLNHETRGHMASDLLRYLFCCCDAQVNTDYSPDLENLPSELLPDHKNAKRNKANEKRGYFSDRFRVQVYGKPATTITCHISKDGHYFIHPDPKQCRSLTVREAARIQTFPDNYFFCGPRTIQYNQVGNAVPPLLAKQLAEVVWPLIKQRL